MSLSYHDNGKLILIAGLAVTFGAQNAAARQFGVQELSTTVLTSTIVGIGVDSRLAGGSGEREKLRYTVVVTMLAGAAVGATMSRFMVAPVIGLAAAVVASQPRDLPVRAASGWRSEPGMAEFVKRNANAPRGFFACEAAGLAWLGGVTGGVPCARVLRHRRDHASPWSACATHRPMWRRRGHSAGGWPLLTTPEPPRFRGTAARLGRARVLRPADPAAADEPDRTRPVGGASTPRSGWFRCSSTPRPGWTGPPEPTSTAW